MTCRYLERILTFLGHFVRDCICIEHLKNGDTDSKDIILSYFEHMAVQAPLNHVSVLLQHTDCSCRSVYFSFCSTKKYHDGFDLIHLT